MTTTDDISNPRHEGHEPEELDTEQAERIPFGRNPRHFGIDPGEPWPDDVPLDQDDTHWRFENDPKAARRAELKIAACFMVTLLASLGLCVVYVTGANNQLGGLCWALAFLGLGVGMILWARDLLPSHEVTASRGHHAVSPEGDRVAVAESLSRGIEPMFGPRFGRRTFLAKLLLPVGGVFGIATLFPIASLGPRTHGDLKHTSWGKGTRAVTEDGRPLRPSDIPVNGIVTVFPEGHMDDALGPTLLINVGSADFRIVPGNQGYNIPTDGGAGIVAFSKICTHAGCPASLFNRTNYQLVCPCHESQFDILLNAKPVFGPAPRSLPQLPLTVDGDGYIVSQSDYPQPVGPGFWDR
jgi:ubiquinol-cytochrome c reductase iron-sulfur subunit